MKTHSFNRLCAAGFFACMSFALAACDSQGSTPTTPTVVGAAPGPNAGLSNAELLSKAVGNMRSLQSYHFEEKGGIPDDSFRMSPNTSIVGDIQASGAVSRVTISDESGHLDWIVTSDGSHYESYDGGKIWNQPTGDTAGDFMVGYMGPLWSGRAPGQMIVGVLTLKDGNPASETIDGVYTKHLTANTGGFTQYAKGATSLDIWVSTDITPTIRQLRIQGGNILPTNKVGGADSVAFSPDGKTLAVGHEDSTVRVWDLTKPGTPPRKLAGKQGNFLSIAFSPDGKTLAAGMYGDSAGAVYMWDATNFDADPIVLATSTSVRSIAFRPDGKMLAAGTEQGAYLWEPPYSNTKATLLPHSGSEPVYSLAFNPDNHILATGALETGVRLYDLRNPEISPVLLKGRWVPGLAFSPDRQKLIASEDLRVWDMGKPGTPAIELPEGNQIEVIALSPDGQKLVGSGNENLIQMWTMSNLSAPPITIGKGQKEALAFSPDGKTLAAPLYTGEVELWDVQNPGPTLTPIILKEDAKAANTTFTLTWTWSRFNEDLGEVKTPATETIKKP